jgi:hypothetical protein
MKKNLTSRQVLSRMRRGDLPINRASLHGPGLLFKDGTQSTGLVLRRLVALDAVVPPIYGSGLRTYQLQVGGKTCSRHD